jgi:hypothetical protein
MKNKIKEKVIMLLMCWCFNVRDHTLTTESLVPMHRYPENGDSQGI